MLQKKGFSILLAGVLLQACATAPGPANDISTASAAETVPQQTADGADPNERICREVEGTGWRFGSREECKTRAQWEASAPGGDP
jgi:hypothetical protein